MNDCPRCLRAFGGDSPDVSAQSPNHEVLKLVKKFSQYEIGATGAIACQMDQRFSYCLYVPRQLLEQGLLPSARILVAIHGTGRGNQAVRDFFIDLADELGLIILAPLFPIGIVEPGDLDSYKYVEFRGIRFDLVLLAMVEEIRSKYGLADDRISVFGFSGGAHMAHRLVYLHPHRLVAVSVCAPGSPTLLDCTRDWWIGIRDIEQKFGVVVNLPAMRSIAIHLAVGDKDLDRSEITHAPGGRNWLPGANDTGRTRVERLRSLSKSLQDSRLDVTTEILPGVAHDCAPLAQAACTFFRTRLAFRSDREKIGA